MIYMVCRNRVADYARWKMVFDSHAKAHRAAGLELVHFWRSLEDPNNVFYVFEVADIERARAFVKRPGSEEAAEAAGVLDGELHFVARAAGYAPHDDGYAPDV
ncbi:hypothetical protein [Crenobacter cavernae]|uniref:Cyclase n=1 Tax=Crenobacter cavernae TaxID=2290923 RepID=A0A345Y818_9NEIS|nr:hypothetical protein [Crenobacter cavernae]AXK40070.1 hypothetical protein DWG20_11805 [Crenobacter cavernae]RXZ42097.1 hypothetical protein EBB06_13695 [Crenobacter cavernae]